MVSLIGTCSDRFLSLSSIWFYVLHTAPFLACMVYRGALYLWQKGKKAQKMWRKTGKVKTPAENQKGEVCRKPDNDIFELRKT